MSTLVRAALSTTAGVLVTTILAYLGALVFVVARMGIPLGSEGRDPTGGEYVGLLLIAAAAAAVGGRIAVGIARQHGRQVVSAQSVILAAVAFSFLTPASRWPTWWAPALAAAFVIGTWLGAATALKVSPPG